MSALDRDYYWLGLAWLGLAWLGLANFEYAANHDVKRQAQEDLMPHISTDAL
jgi:hypothetical protein